MEKYHNKPGLKYLLVLCISLMLVLSQTNRLHMHIEHEDHSSVASAHVINLHTSTLLHEMDLLDHHGDQHSATIDINADHLVKKTNSLNPLLLFVLFIGLFLYIPRLICLSRQSSYQVLFNPCYYLLHPPLRAPPVK